MRRAATTLAALALLGGLGLAGMAIAKGGGPKPTLVRAGSMELAINGDITPRALPRNKLAPMGIWGSGRLTTVDGSHPPALEEAVFDADKDAFVGVKGLPSCRLGQLQARATKEAEAACGETVLGRGSVTVEVAFPEQKPFTSTGPLVLFNGGERDGVVRVLAHAYVDVPAPTAVVATVEIRRVAKGAFGLHIEAQVPKIAGGSGSVVGARFDVRRIYAHAGKRLSFISGRCPDGRMQGRGTFRYSDGTSLTGTLVRPCTARE